MDYETANVVEWWNIDVLARRLIQCSVPDFFQWAFGHESAGSDLDVGTQRHLSVALSFICTLPFPRIASPLYMQADQAGRFPFGKGK